MGERWGLAAPLNVKSLREQVYERLKSDMNAGRIAPAGALQHHARPGLQP